MDSSFPALRCIYDLSTVLSNLISFNLVLVYAFKSEVQIKKNYPLFIFVDHYND